MPTSDKFQNNMEYLPDRDWSIEKEIVHRGKTIVWLKSKKEPSGWYIARLTDGMVDWINETDKDCRFQ